jgi:AcrR family transcriptional regulator
VLTGRAGGRHCSRHLPEVSTVPTGSSRPARTGKAAAPKAEIAEAEWIAAAREVLIAEGVAAIKVDRLARRLGVTRGGFYWRFNGLPALLEALVADWRDTNSVAVLSALEGPGSPRKRFQELMHVWIEEAGFSPAYDSAVRDWGRTDPKVAAAVAAVDARRLAAFEQLFRDAGYAPREALVRARITYYHQVGYYALGVSEARERRWALSTTYRRILTGWD